MLVQDYLRSGGTLAGLTTEFSVSAKVSSIYSNLVLLKYDQIESPMGLPIVQECRGVILDSGADWRVVARPFDKFFNAGEGHAKPIDFSTARVQDKLDGSMMTVFNYGGVWNVATSGHPDAAGQVGDNPFTFAELFWKTWKAADLRAAELDHDLTYVFELTSKFNRVVVVHDEPKLRLIGVRNRVTGQEVPTSVYVGGQFDVVREHPLQSLEDVVSTFAKLNPLQTEGYVIVDGGFNRIKVKHPGYVALHHLKEGMGPKRILEVVRSGESSELSTYFPEWSKEIERARVRFEALVRELEDSYEEIRTIPAQKDFALQAQKTRHPGTLFALRSGKMASVKQSLAAMSIDKLADIVG